MSITKESLEKLRAMKWLSWINSSDDNGHNTNKNKQDAMTAGFDTLSGPLIKACLALQKECFCYASDICESCETLAEIKRELGIE